MGKWAGLLKSEAVLSYFYEMYGMFNFSGQQISEQYFYLFSKIKQYIGLTFQQYFYLFSKIKQYNGLTFKTVLLIKQYV